jgi:hypothetical protein
VAEPAHSPAPFQLRGGNPPPVGYVIYDAMGDSIGALAYATGDHPAEEQLANARLFTASPSLLAALKLLNEVRPFNWDDGDDPRLKAAWEAADAAMAEAEGGA